MKVSRGLPENSPETVQSEIENKEVDREIQKEKYISSQKRQPIIDKLRLIY